MVQPMGRCFGPNSAETRFPDGSMFTNNVFLDNSDLDTGQTPSQSEGILVTNVPLALPALVLRECTTMCWWETSLVLKIGAGITEDLPAVALIHCWLAAGGEQSPSGTGWAARTLHEPWASAWHTSCFTAFLSWQASAGTRELHPTTLQLLSPSFMEAKPSQWAAQSLLSTVCPAPQGRSAGAPAGPGPLGPMALAAQPAAPNTASCGSALLIAVEPIVSWSFATSAMMISFWTAVNEANQHYFRFITSRAYS